MRKDHSWSDHTAVITPSATSRLVKARPHRLRSCAATATRPTTPFGQHARPARDAGHGQGRDGGLRGRGDEQRQRHSGPGQAEALGHREPEQGCRAQGRDGGEQRRVDARETHPAEEDEEDPGEEPSEGRAREARGAQRVFLPRQGLGAGEQQVPESRKERVGSPVLPATRPDHDLQPVREVRVEPDVRRGRLRQSRVDEPGGEPGSRPRRRGRRHRPGPTRRGRSVFASRRPSNPTPACPVSPCRGRSAPGPGSWRR